MTYTDEQIIEAIEAAEGLISDAARLLGCDRSTIHRRINSSDEVRQAVEDSRAVFLDECESQLKTIIRSPMHKDHFAAIRFALRTVGRSRGYSDRVEVSGPGGGPMQITGDLGDAIGEALRLAGMTPADEGGDDDDD